MEPPRPRSTIALRLYTHRRRFKHSLGMRIIGEGIETKHQLETLQELNCDEIQGFYCCKPVLAKEVTHLLQKNFLIAPQQVFQSDDPHDCS